MLKRRKIMKTFYSKKRNWIGINKGLGKYFQALAKSSIDGSGSRRSSPAELQAHVVMIFDLGKESNP
jgi:hypothetical protein